MIRTTRSSDIELRNAIENGIGRKILDRINQTRNSHRGPTMMPPKPDSKFIEKLPEGALDGQNIILEKENKDSYEAGLKLYRSLEKIKQNYLVIHRLEFTHEQYSAFVGEHLCTEVKCKRGPKVHPCHKQPTDKEGECGIVVVGDNFVAVFEVQALNLQEIKEDEHSQRLQSCCEIALTQRKRMRNLIQSVYSRVIIFEFTVFSNITIDEVGEECLKDDALLFYEDLEIVTSIFNKERLSLSTVQKSARDRLCCSLLGLWCIDREGAWNFNVKCGLTSCVKKIVQKPNEELALVTGKSVDTERMNTITKRGKGKSKTKKYPENPEIVKKKVQKKGVCGCCSM